MATQLWDADAADCDRSSPEMFDPDLLAPTLDLLAELDLTARLAGMTLEHRWADWPRTVHRRQSCARLGVSAAALTHSTADLTAAARHC